MKSIKALLMVMVIIGISVFVSACGSNTTTTKTDKTEAVEETKAAEDVSEVAEEVSEAKVEEVSEAKAEEVVEAATEKETTKSQSNTNSTKQTTEKVKCSMCNGTGKVKYYYGDSALEAALNGKNDYEYGICTSCNGTGYVEVKTSGSKNTSSTSTSSKKETCPSCGKKVDKLITKKDKAGVNRTWCSSCWSDYQAIMGN